VVTDVTIWAWGQGAAMTSNQVNIISGNGYLAKGFFFSALDDRLGPGNWKMVHSVPHSSGAGAIVTSKIEWTVDGKPNVETLEHGIKGDDYSSTDQYLGKADRKCGKWLLERLSNRRYSDGEAENPLTDGAFEVKADVVEDAEPTEATDFMADIKAAAEKTKPKPDPVVEPPKPEPKPKPDPVKPTASVEEVVAALGGAPPELILQFFKVCVKDIKETTEFPGVSTLALPPTAKRLCALSAEQRGYIVRPNVAAMLKAELAAWADRVAKEA